MSKKDKESVEAFYSGVICALLVVVDGHGEHTIAREILRGCDVATVRRIARREGDWSIVKLVDDYRKHAAGTRAAPGLPVCEGEVNVGIERKRK